MLTIIDEAIRDDRHYKLADTPLGRILFYEFGDYVQYRNLTEQDFAWSIIIKDAFLTRFSVPAVEIFTSKRLNGLEKAVKVQVTGNAYHLARKKKYDGYIYEIDASMQRAFTKKDYPDMKFVYTRYYVPAIKMLDRNTIERMKIEALWRFNGHTSYDVAGVSAIIDKVFEMTKEDVQNDAN